MNQPLRQLTCGVSHNDWGKLGKESLVARLSSNSHVDENQTYAELWMGTHPSMPSVDVESNQTLAEYLATNPAMLSGNVFKNYGELPFLLKVLSIEKPLCIQAHPDRDLAARLHAKDPLTYPDANHKPEMIIALTNFEALCGFRPLNEITYLLSQVPAFRHILSAGAVLDLKSICKSTNQAQETLAGLWKSLLMASPELVKACVSELVTWAQENRLDSSPAGLSSLAKLVLRLSKHYPHDVGLFMVFCMNYVSLKAEEALFIRPNEVHAYLSGDGVECMATSANVLRGGFTHKRKDMIHHTDRLLYEHSPPFILKNPAEDIRLIPCSNARSMLYRTTADEFDVVRTELCGGTSARFLPVKGPSILVCIEGKGVIYIERDGTGGHEVNLKEGSVFFLGAESPLAIQAEADVTIFQAFCDISD